MTSPSQKFINRDLSWLQFNDRVSDEAANDTLPLFERLRFLTIAAANLDEFATVRVAGIIDQIWEGDTHPGPDGMAPQDVLVKVLAGLREQTQRLQELWRMLRASLRSAVGLHVLSTDEIMKLSADDQKTLHDMFMRDVFPILTPIAIDPAHAFPFLPNRAMATLYMMRHKKTGKIVREIVPLPSFLPRLIPLPDTGAEKRYILLEHAIRLNLPHLLPDMVIEDFTTFRLLRDADLDLANDSENVTKGLETALRLRQRGDVIQLMLNIHASDESTDFLQRQLGVDDSEVVKIDGQIGLVDLKELMPLAPQEHLFPPMSIRYPERVQECGGDIFAAIRLKDFVVHHPYESFDVVVGMLQQAANDPQVRTIKQTLYRTSSDSPVIKALIEAARNNKSVTAVIELQARFDEEANLRWARDMEREGVHVVFGKIGTKTHAKMSLVARQEGSSIRTYCHLGTGNYHPHTARIYTDLSFFTCDPQIGHDVVRIFNYMTGNSEPHDLEKLSIAPLSLRQRLYEQIDGEIANAKDGKPAHIWLKCNALEDDRIIEKLYEANRAGVKIEAVVRGICSLRPGIANQSENIHVKSIVGRFLEHSRIYAFGNGSMLPNKQARIFMSSADLMHRNLDRRIETLVPIENPTVHSQVLDQIMNANFKDNTQSWDLQSDATYIRQIPVGKPFTAHDYFIKNPSLSGRGKAMTRGGRLPPSLGEIL